MPYNETSWCGEGMCAKFKDKNVPRRSSYFSNTCTYCNHTIHNRFGLIPSDDIIELALAYRCRRKLALEIWINEFKSNNIFRKFDTLGLNPFSPHGTYY